MIKVLNRLFNIVFFISLFLAILSLFCRIVKTLSLDLVIFQSFYITIIITTVIISISFILSLRLHRLLAHLQAK